MADDSYQLKQDAISALINLGFRKADVMPAIDAYLRNNTAADIELIISAFCEIR